MNHVTSRLAAYLAGELDPRQREQVAAHLQMCEACRREYTAQAAIWEMLGAAGDPSPTGPSVWPAVRARTVAVKGSARSVLGWAAAALVAGVLLGVSLPDRSFRSAATAAVSRAGDDASWLQSSWLLRDTGDDLASGWLLAGLDDGGGS